jgi:hypothetical protein
MTTYLATALMGLWMAPSALFALRDSRLSASWGGMVA